jgi:CrcB protein
VSASASRPLHVRKRALALVALGGAVGTGLREALALLMPAQPQGFPVTIFVINLAGSFALGLLLETLSRRGADEGRRRVLRLLIGTGVIGGFTTYSSFATDVASRLGPAAGVAFGYAAASLVLGCLAAFAGIAVAAAFQPRRPGLVSLETEEEAG